MTKGGGVTSVTKAIVDRTHMTANHAKLIANDQTGSIISQLDSYRAKRAGARKYIWRSMEDNRARPKHRELDGTEQVYGNPDGGDDGQMPGEPIRCRCVALPVFDEVDSKHISSNSKQSIDDPNNLHELFHKNSYYFPSTEYISSYELNKLVRKFVRKGGVVAIGTEADTYLRSVGASASTWGKNTVMISSWATKSAVVEELYHTTQLKRLGVESMGSLSELEYDNMEVEAQLYLLKNAKK
ncbi:minor capsid protein [Lactobacillus pasteurii]